jgi:hypothetical protein
MVDDRARPSFNPRHSYEIYLQCLFGIIGAAGRRPASTICNGPELPPLPIFPSRPFPPVVWWTGCLPVCS